MGDIIPSRINFDALDMNLIQRIYTTGSLAGLPEAEQWYYCLMEKVRGLRARMKMNGRLVTKAGIIRNLKEADHLSDYQARRVYADAVNFFYDSDEVRPQAWANLYAERCENWANLLFTSGKPREARHYLKLAAELRGCYRKDEGTEIPRELLDQQPTVIYTTSAEDLGLPPTDRQRVAAFIDSLPEVPAVVRDRVKEDARLKTFDLRRRILYDKAELAETAEDEKMKD